MAKWSFGNFSTKNADDDKKDDDKVELPKELKEVAPNSIPLLYFLIF